MVKHNQPAGVGMMPCTTELGTYVRARRLELDLRQVQLAKRAKLRQQDITRCERGARKYFSERQLLRLAKALRVDPEELRKRMPKKFVAQIRTEVRKLISSRRTELGLSFSAFAKKMKMTRVVAKQLETRPNPTIGYGLARRLASALDLDVSVFAPFVVKERKQTTSMLGQLVRSRRKELGLSGRALAQKLGVTHQQVNHIELGKCSLCENDAMIQRLAEALGLDVSRLQAVRPVRKRKYERDSGTLGGFLAAKRLALHLTQGELGRLVGISGGMVSQIESNRARVSAVLIEKVAKALECEIPTDLVLPLSRGNRKPRCHAERPTPLGMFLSMRRIELGLIQKQVAERAGITPPYIAMIERGRVHKPRRRTLEKLAKALECEIPAGLNPKPSEIPASHHPVPKKKGEATREAHKIRRLLLEKQSEGYTVCLRKGDEVVELEPFE